jgi:hypothetical protein
VGCKLALGVAAPGGCLSLHVDVPKILKVEASDYRRYCGGDFRLVHGQGSTFFEGLGAAPKGGDSYYDEPRRSAKFGGET